MSLRDLSDEALVDGLRDACREANRISARIVEYLVEVEVRGLHKRSARWSSMFEFCTRGLGMSAGGACRRIAAARLVRRFPRLLERLETGEIPVSTLELLRSHLTVENFDEVVNEVAGKGRKAVEEILARRAPKPDVPAMICALSPERHALQLTISGETRAKVERARDLMRHRNPTGDLETIVDRALDALLVKLEKERLGKVARPRASCGTEKGRISAATRREVFDRDGERCTFRDEGGERCSSTSFLELDHVVPRALGGSDEAINLRVTCRTHNSFYAEQIFGAEHMRLCQQRISPPLAEVSGRRRSGP